MISHKDVAVVSFNMLESSISSREKDYTDFFPLNHLQKTRMSRRRCSWHDERQQPFLLNLRSTTDDFNTRLEKIVQGLTAEHICLLDKFSFV